MSFLLEGCKSRVSVYYEDRHFSGKSKKFGVSEQSARRDGSKARASSLAVCTACTLLFLLCVSLLLLNHLFARPDYISVKLGLEPAEAGRDLSDSPPSVDMYDAQQAINMNQTSVINSLLFNTSAIVSNRHISLAASPSTFKGEVDNRMVLTELDAPFGGEKASGLTTSSPQAVRIDHKATEKKLFKKRLDWKSTEEGIVLSPMLELRRQMFRRYGTWYGCDEDSTIQAMKGQLRFKLRQRSLLQQSLEGRNNTKKEYMKDGEINPNKAVEKRTVNYEAIQDIKDLKKQEEKFYYQTRQLENDTSSILHKRLASGPINGTGGRMSERGNDGTKVARGDEQRSDVFSYSASHGINPIATLPHRIGILFLINKELKHPKLWTTWLDIANHWSYDLYKKKEGPYSLVTTNEPYLPLFSLHVHFMGGTGGLYTSLRNVWRRWGLLAVEDSLREAENEPRLKLPKVFQDALIPSLHCGWGDLNPCEYQLLKYGLKDVSTNGFIFISESTIPVKSFEFIYKEFEANPRSRFFYSNINLPLVRKHHQWIVLNRSHAYHLVNNPIKWICNNWMVHHYSNWHVIGNYAAPDEYLPFYALSDILGIDQIMLEINDGKQEDLRKFDNKGQVHGNRNFRHTWVCWLELPEYISTEICSAMGEYILRSSSPVEYHTVYAEQFTKTILKSRHVWFARKFSRHCTVQFNTTTDQFTTLIKSSEKGFNQSESSFSDLECREAANISESLNDDQREELLLINEQCKRQQMGQGQHREPNSGGGMNDMYLENWLTAFFKREWQIVS